MGIGLVIVLPNRYNTLRIQKQRYWQVYREFISLPEHISQGRVCMKLNGTHKFKANSWQVFNAIVNPQVLKECIPGCNSVEILDNTRLKANITTPLPGLKGPYGVVINMTQRQDPNLLVLEVKRKGTGGSVNATSQITIQDEPDGALLTYDANADLEALSPSPTTRSARTSPRTRSKRSSKSWKRPSLNIEPLP